MKRDNPQSPHSKILQESERFKLEVLELLDKDLIPILKRVIERAKAGDLKAAQILVGLAGPMLWFG